jgi:1-acyl-sn-glycerol-3-phosphate acyltransferase
LAKKTNVPIVPISISHAHAIYPGNSLFPVQRGKGKLHVHIHDPIDTSDKTEAELGELVRTSLLSELPFVQHPIKKDVIPGSVDIPLMQEPTAATSLEPEQVEVASVEETP